MERLAIDQRNGVEPTSNVNTTPSDPSLVLTPVQQEATDKAAKEDADTATQSGNNKNGSMRKKLTGKTYHHIKDMFTTKFNKSSKSKLNGSENNASASSPAVNGQAAHSASVVAAAAAAAEAIIAEHTAGQQNAGSINPSMANRQPDPVHSINQRIKSQLTGQNQSTNQNHPQQVWGSYGRQSTRMEASINECDASALAKLTLSPAPNGQENLVPAQSPYNLRHKPSVTFRMDLNNECQYSGGDNSSSSAVPGATESRYGSRPAPQGQQVVLYDDTMHFPQQTQTAKQEMSSHKNSYEHDSSLSSIASAGQGMKNRSVFGYSDYDVPPNKSQSLNSPTLNEGGSSSGHQSAGSSSDLDKRSGQSISTNDSGLGVLPDQPVQRSRSNTQPSYHLDTSTETDMFVVRAAGQLNHSSSDWADAADREVNNVMELRNYQSKQQQQQHGLQSATPPLPPLSPDASPKPTPKLQQKFSNSKPDLLEPANGPSPMVQRVKPTTPAKASRENSIHHQQRNHIHDNHQSKSNHQHAKRRGDDKNKSLSSAKLRGNSKSTGNFVAARKAIMYAYTKLVN